MGRIATVPDREAKASVSGTLGRALRRERAIGAGVVTAAVLWLFGLADQPIAHVGPAAGGVLLAWILGVALCCVFAVVRHAELLAERLGEPAGTLVLTLSVTLIEATTISRMMLHGENNPTLTRDTMFAVLMIILNGMIGLTLLVGAILHRVQEFNLHGAGAYLNLIVPLSVLALVLPNFTRASDAPMLAPAQELYLVVVALVLYGVFLIIQTIRHRTYFDGGESYAGPPMPAALDDGAAPPSAWHVLGLVAALALVVTLSEEVGQYVDYGIEVLKFPAALGGIFIGALVLAPEALASLRAALANHLQRSVNVCLGAALAAISLTLPAVLLTTRFTGRPIELGLGSLDTLLLALTLAVSLITFATGRTNVLQGAVHLLLFATYLFLIVVP